MTEFIIGMRDAYFEELYKIFKADPNAVFITADNGAPSLDRFAAEMPDQYYTVGIAEQQMMGMAAGMAIEGRKVYTYAIAPFVTQRIAEFVKLDQCAMNANIINLAVGAGYSYDIMGPTHHTVEDIALMRSYPNLTIWSPSDANVARQLAQVAHSHQGPGYIRFDRAGIPDLYNNQMFLDLSKGIFETRHGNDDVSIISTGRFVYQALLVADLLKQKGINAQVLDVVRLKPFPIDEMIKLVDDKHIVTFEEHLLAGGLGSIVLESINDTWIEDSMKGEVKYEMTAMNNILRIGVPDEFTFDMGGRSAIWEKYSLDPESVSNKIERWLK